MKRLPGRVALALLSFAASLALAEAAMSWWRPVTTMQPLELREGEWQSLMIRRSSTPGLYFELAPNFEKEVAGVLVRTNGLGMRGPEPGTDCSQHIAVLGDSVTFGWGVRQEDIWPLVLDEKLRKADSAYCVLNFAVPDYATPEELEVLRSKVLRWQPRIVILAYVLNDPETDPLGPLQQTFGERRWWQRFHLGRWTVRKLRSRQIELLGNGDLYQYLHSPGAAKWRVAQEHLREIARISLGAGARAILVIFPLLPRTTASWAEYPYKNIHERVASAGQSGGFEVVDLLEPFAQVSPADLRISVNDGTHPSAAGHAVAAARLASQIRASRPQ